MKIIKKSVENSLINHFIYVLEKESLRKTWQNRPDLLKRLVLDAKSRIQLNDIINEGNSSKEDTKE